MGTGSNKAKSITSEYYAQIKTLQLQIYKNYSEQDLYITIIEPEKNYEGWKDVLYKLLGNSQYKWARELEAFIDEEPFIIENKWRDHIFYTSFSQMLNNVSTQQNVLNSRFGGLQLEEFELLLQRQLWNPYNPFNQIMRKYCSILLRENSHSLIEKPQDNTVTDVDLGVIAKGSFSSPNQYEDTLKKVNDSICGFAHIIVRSVKAYYKMALDQKKAVHDLQDTLYFTCLQDILSDSTYDMLRRLYQHQYKKQESILKQKVAELQKIDTKDMIKNEYHGLYQKEKVFDMLEKKAQASKQRMSELFPAKYIEYITRNTNNPYIDVISKLKEFEKGHSIREKFLLLKSFKAEIENSITKFWKYLQISPEKLAITADSLLDICQYVIIKAQCSTLFADIAMMNDYFCKIAKGEVAYILTTFQCALSCIMEIAKENHPLKQIMRKQVKCESVLVLSDED